MGTIKEKVNKDIQAQRSKGLIEKSKIDQAFAKYNLNVDEQEVKEAVKKIIAEKVPENDTIDVKKFLLGSVELTSLHTTDTEESILSMVEKVNKFDANYPDLPHVATIVTYPNFTHLVRNTLEVDGVEIAVVSGSFPSSQTFMEVKVAETALALRDGATNVDIVLPVGKFLSEDYEGVADDINELKQTCGDVPMKVILETCDLGSLSNVKKAAILSMYSGADYIKTSTGKDIKEYYDETGIIIGIKPAGGINTVMDAIIYYTIVKEILGEEWLTNELFRLGTSRLTNLLLSEVLGKDIKWY